MHKFIIGIGMSLWCGIGMNLWCGIGMSLLCGIGMNLCSARVGMRFGCEMSVRPALIFRRAVRAAAMILETPF